MFKSSQNVLVLLFLSITLGAPILANAALEARLAEIEAKLSQMDTPQKTAGGIRSNCGHVHQHLPIDQVTLTGGLDAQLFNQSQAQGFVINEAQLGLQAPLKANLDLNLEFAIHNGESMEVHQGYLQAQAENLMLRAGQFRLNISQENKECFFGHRTIAPSLIQERIFGPHGWLDTGLEISGSAWGGAQLSMALTNGDNASFFANETGAAANKNLALVVAAEKNLANFAVGAAVANGRWDGLDQYNFTVSTLHASWLCGAWELLGEYQQLNRDGGLQNEQVFGHYLYGIYHAELPLAWAEKGELLVGFGCVDSNAGGLVKNILLQPTLFVGDLIKLRGSYTYLTDATGQMLDRNLTLQMAIGF